MAFTWPFTTAAAAFRIVCIALPMAWAEQSTGSWVSPQRRRVIMVGSVQVESPDILPRPRWYAIDLDADFTNGKQELRRAALIRTARRIFEGNVLVPESIWAGERRSEQDRPRERAAA